MRFRNIILLALFPALIQAQIGMGQWRTHFCYNGMSQIEETPDAIFGISDGALFSVNKEDNLITTYSKIDGQHDFLASFIRYNSTTKSLFIAYKNGNIDLLSDEGITNIPDIKNKAVSASKTPNDIIFRNEYAYISCGIGIVVVNLSKKEITDSYIIGNNSTLVEVKSTVFFGDSIYALTADGIYSAYKDNPLLVDYNNWSYRTNATLSLPENKKIVEFNNNLYLLKSTGEVYTSSDAYNWTVFDNTQSSEGIKVAGNSLLIHSINNIIKYNKSLVSEHYSGLSIKDIIYNKADNAFWIASADATGILKMQSGSIIKQYKPDGPATNKIINIQLSNGYLYALTGAKWEVDYLGIAGAVMIKDESNSWKNTTQIDINKYTGRPFMDLTNIAVDPNDNKHFFVSTYGFGLFEFKNNVYSQVYYGENSGLENSGNSPGWCIVDGIIFDKYGDLWMCNDVTPASLKVLHKNNSWTPLTYSQIKNSNSFDKIIITDNGFKWLNRQRGGGIFILNDKNDPSSQYNHQYIEYSTTQKDVIDQDGNNIQFDNTFCMAKDLDDNVWIGTASGPIVFENIENVFNNNYTVYRPKISRADGSDYADYLLEGDKINAIAVDGANRKWLGTANSGVFLMSEDGIETIQHFTKENSPLLSNSILSIAINNKTGEVFFATDMGLVSYMSDATLPEETYETISVYPNPVRENFSGVITISGLIDETIVKITDSAGNMVYQTKSNGGTATWSGYTNAGIKVSTGVYFVMVSNGNEKNTDNIQTSVGKILILK